MKAIIKAIVSVFTAVSCCITGLFATAGIRLNPEKYNYITAEAGKTPAPVTEMSKDAFVQLSEVKMHYQVYGKGAPLILIHGNGGNCTSLRSVGQLLADRYRVYIIESRCHGQSSDPGVITYSLMAKDVAEFTEKLGIRKPVIMGHSDGAIVALSVASEYPGIPSAVIACGANSRPEAAWFQFRFWVHWENLLEKDKLNDLMLSGPDFTEEYLGRITCPCFIVSGDSDLMPVSDTYYIYKSIPQADIAVLKGENHGSYFEDPAKIYTLAVNWLDSLKTR